MSSQDTATVASPGVDSFTNPSLFNSTFIVPRMQEQAGKGASANDEDNLNNDKKVEEDEPKHAIADFGGPEDFTEHLSEYMFGIRDFKKREDTGAKPDPVVKDAKNGRQTPNQEDQNETEQSSASKDTQDIDGESLSEPIASSTPSPKETTHLHLHLGEESPQLPSPKLRIAKTRPSSPEHDSADTFRRVSELQAEIEKMREEEIERRKQQIELERENEELRKENEEAYRRFEEIDRLSQPDHDQVDEANVESNRNPKEQFTSDETIKSLQHELKMAQSSYTKLESEFASFKESGSDVVAHLKESLLAQREETESERNKSFVIAREAAKLNDTKEQHEATIQHLRSEIESLTTDFAKTRDDLQETKRILQDVEDENDKLADENAEQKAWIDSHREDQESSSTELRAAHQTIATLRSKVQTQRTESNLKAQHAREIAALTSQHERAVSAIKARHTKDVMSLRTALQTSTANRKKSESELERHHNVEIDGLRARIADLEALEGISSQSAEEELRSAIRVMNTKLSKGNLVIKGLRGDVVAAKKEGEGWKGKYEDLRGEFEEREEEWNRRIDLLFKDRDRLAKIVMVQWGREECGKGTAKGEGQLFRYKYVGKGKA